MVAEAVVMAVFVLVVVVEPNEFEDSPEVPADEINIINIMI